MNMNQARAALRAMETAANDSALEIQQGYGEIEWIDEYGYTLSLGFFVGVGYRGSKATGQIDSDGRHYQGTARLKSAKAGRTEADSGPDGVTMAGECPFPGCLYFGPEVFGVPVKITFSGHPKAEVDVAICVVAEEKLLLLKQLSNINFGSGGGVPFDP